MIILHFIAPFTEKSVKQVIKHIVNSPFIFASKILVGHLWWNGLTDILNSPSILFRAIFNHAFIATASVFNP